MFNESQLMLSDVQLLLPTHRATRPSKVYKRVMRALVVANVTMVLVLVVLSGILFWTTGKLPDYVKDVIETISPIELERERGFFCSDVQKKLLSQCKNGDLLRIIGCSQDNGFLQFEFQCMLDVESVDVDSVDVDSVDIDFVHDMCSCGTKDVALH